MTNWYAGTGGFRYEEWKGTYYAENLPEQITLGEHAEHLPATGINNTFHRMSCGNVIRKWADSAPGDFRFIIKSSRHITQQQRLKDAGKSVSLLTIKLDALVNKFSGTLFQLPPYLRADNRFAVFDHHDVGARPAMAARFLTATNGTERRGPQAAANRPRLVIGRADEATTSTTRARS